ncbi:MAG: hypothetical protein K1X29_05715 [Bdellovibrionales bacterium]|nr:hypothetical protein [Bdellovibrionales bacterium]
MESELDEVAKPYAHLIEKLDEIPGVDKILSVGILAEATNQMKKNAKSKRKSFYRAKYNKLVFKLDSKNKAKVTISNSIARSVY